MLQQIQDLDEKTSLYVVRHRFSPKLHKGLQWYTRLGDGYVWALVVAYIFWTQGKDDVYLAVQRCFLAGGISLAIYMAVKYATRRQRPFEKLPEIAAEVPPLDAYSFPSGHTMNNLAAGLTLALLQPQIGWIVVLMPLTWGALRIYFGVHWLSDVVVGALLGGASFLLGVGVWNWLL